MEKEYLVGVIENRHEPPTNGHVYMIEWSYSYLKAKARSLGKEAILYVIVASNHTESIDGHLRFEWTKNLFPQDNIKIRHAHDVLRDFSEFGFVYDSKDEKGYGSEKLWGKVATELFDIKPDYLFASEGYGPGIAKYAGAEFVACDFDRSNIPVSGTEIREYPMENWKYIPRFVRGFFAKKICIVGAEYTGKEKLATHLANHYDTYCVPEFANKIYDNNKRKFSIDDLREIAYSHIAGRDALLAQSNKMLISNTDLLTTLLWGSEIDETLPGWIHKEADKKVFDLFLLMSPEGLDHVPGNTHKTEKEWLAFSEKIEMELQARGWPYVKISGTEMQKKQKARMILNGMVWDKKKLVWGLG